MKILLLALPLALLFLACDRDEKFTTSGGDKLEFSLDTLRFDTVFTELGSATRFFRVYNRHSESIKISRIFLAGSQQSKFNLNVDGLPGGEHRDVVVYPKDSIYVFAEVTVNPDDPLSASPFFVYDSVMFEVNGNVQSVTLEAFGQNANYIPSRFAKELDATYDCGGEWVWDDPKPYVVYGRVAFENCTLTLPPGTRVHIHGGLVKRVIDPDSAQYFNSGLLYFGENARLNVLGTAEDSVVIQGDRLEEDFQDADGQWYGIYFSPGSTGNRLEFATIKNSLFGLYADSAAELTLKNVQVFNTTGVGLLALHASVTAENCLFFNNGGHSVQLAYGGTHSFIYCTLANYGTDVAALYMDNGFCDEPSTFGCASPPRLNDLSADFLNCIIFGSKRDEILIGDWTGGADLASLDYHFSHCIVRVDELPGNFPDFPTRCDVCIFASSQDALFADTGEDDYHLDTLSIAEEMALPVLSILTDLEGDPRDPVKPDIGCYEYKVE